MNKNRWSAGVERANLSRRIDELDAMVLEFQIVSNLRQQRARGGCETRTAEAGIKFFSDASAADNFATLKHEWPQSRPREIVRGDETVVTGSDDDDVVLCTFHF